MKSRILKLLPARLFLSSLFFLTVMGGCSNNQPEPASPSDSTSSKSKKADNKRLCESSLENILSVVDLENLSSVFQRSNGVLFFNEWKQECQVEEDIKPSERSLDLLKKHFSEAALKRLQKPDFDGRDVEHLRTATLFRKMAMNTVEDASNDLERTIALYQLSIRNISLAPAFAANVPRTPYDAMLFSLGGTEDRAWIFSILLRQIHIDSFLIRPNEKSKHFLVGVPLDGEVYLFDPAYGVPVASLEDNNALAKKPATLKEVRKSSKIFEQFAFGDKDKHPFADADFSKFQIDLIGDSSLWAPRMEPFESRLKGDETCTLYSAIESTDLDQELGEINRAIKNGGLDEDNISWSIWSFPEEMLTKYENPTEQEKAFMASVRQSFDMVFDKIVKNKNDSQSVEELKSDRVFLKARTRHLIGDYNTSIPSYMKFRMSARKIKKQGLDLSQATLPIQMGQQATYWSGLCKYEEGNFEAAIHTMENSLRVYPNGIQSGPARIIKALAEAEMKQLDKAIESFQKLPETNSEYKMAQYFIKRWKKKTESENKSSKPEIKPMTKQKQASANKKENVEGSAIPPAPKTPELEK